MNTDTASHVCGRDHRYSGWTNYETWCVALWIDNDEGLYLQKREMAQQALKDARTSGDYFIEEQREIARHPFADMLKNWVADEMVPTGTGLACDLLSAALSEVNWSEIAEHWLSDEE